MDRKNLIEKLVSQKLASPSNRKAFCICMAGKPTAQKK